MASFLLNGVMLGIVSALVLNIILNGAPKARETVAEPARAPAG